MREDQRRGARAIAAKLKENGYLVPGIENVEKKTRKQQTSSDLRYFHDDEVSQKDVDDIAGVLRGAGVAVSRTPRTDSDVRPRQYEIWFGEDFSPPSDSPGRIIGGPDLLKQPREREDSDKKTPDQGRQRRTYP